MTDREDRGRRENGRDRRDAGRDRAYREREYRERDYREYRGDGERRRHRDDERYGARRYAADPRHDRREGYDERARRPRRDERYYEDEPRRRRSGGRRRKKHTGRNVLLVLLVLILLAAGAAMAYMGRIDRTSLKNLIQNAGVSQTGYRNFVIYGVDSRTGDMTKDTHSDTIMICSINKRTKEVKLVSVYRDTYLDNTNGEYRKATECYYFGGPERSINMLNKNLDLDLSDYVTVDFNAVIKVVDALGGIDLEITDEEMNYINGYCVENKQVTGVDYTPLTYSGYVHLDGIQALAYCRIRYTEGWDYKRTERQRTVMNLCYEKAKQQGIPVLVAIANNLMPSISTSMSNMEIISLVSGMGGYTMGEQTGFPFEKQGVNLADAGDAVAPINLAANVTQLHAFLFGEQGYVPSATVQEISNTISANTGLY